MDCSKIPGIPASKVSHCWSASAGAAMHEKRQLAQQGRLHPWKKVCVSLWVKERFFQGMAM